MKKAVPNARTRVEKLSFSSLVGLHPHSKEAEVEREVLHLKGHQVPPVADWILRFDEMPEQTGLRVVELARPLIVPAEAGLVQHCLRQRVDWDR